MPSLSAVASWAEYNCCAYSMKTRSVFLNAQGWCQSHSWCLQRHADKHSFTTLIVVSQDARALSDLMPLLRHLRAVLDLAVQAEDVQPHEQNADPANGGAAPAEAGQATPSEPVQEQTASQHPAAAAPASVPAAQQPVAAEEGGAQQRAAETAAALRAAVEAVAEEVAAEAGRADDRFQAMQAAQELIEQYMQFADRIQEGERPRSKLRPSMHAWTPPPGNPASVHWGN